MYRVAAPLSPGGSIRSAATTMRSRMRWRCSMETYRSNFFRKSTSRHSSSTGASGGSLCRRLCASRPEILQAGPPTLSGQPDFPEGPAIHRMPRNAHRRCRWAVEAPAVEHERSGRNLSQVQLPLIVSTQFTTSRHPCTLGYPITSRRMLPSRYHLSWRKVEELPQNIIFRDSSNPTARKIAADRRDDAQLPADRGGHLVRQSCVGAPPQLLVVEVVTSSAVVDAPSELNSKLH